MVCNDFKAYSVDLKTGDTKFLRRFSSVPYAIKTITSLSILAIGEKSGAIVYIYKYNPDTDIFEAFITIYPN